MSLVFILLCLVDVNSALNWDQQHPWLWSRIDAAGFKPAARQGHASVEVGRNIYVIGGCKQQIKCYNDVHLFSTENLNWQQQPLSGQLPEPRGGHSASLSGRQIVVFGGANGEETFEIFTNLTLSAGVGTMETLLAARRPQHLALIMQL